MSRVFANPLTELAEFEQLQECLKKKKGPVQVSGCLDSQKVHLMQETVADRPWKLVVTYDDARAREIYDDFGCFRDNVWLYPAKDLLFYSADIHGNLLTRERLQVLRHLMEDQNGVVVTTMDGLMDHLLPLRCMQEQVLHLETGQELDLEAWKLRLAELGYERMPQVDGMGQFSVRGGILDIYPLTEELPVRIELWDTEVDSIRTFDLESQRSIEQLDEIDIYPATEIVLTKKQAREGIERIRIGSLEPRIITEETAAKMAALPKLCPHFHLSLQSGCDATLRRMNRKYTSEEYAESVALLRKVFDHPAITTDVIVGFPGETEEEFTQTKEFLDRIQFFEMHIFKYSKRAGTRAAVMSHQVPDPVKTTRSGELLAMEKEQSKRFRAHYLGREAEVLLEEIKELDGVEYLLGHTRDYVKVAVPLTENGEKAVTNTVVRGTVEGFVNDEILLLSPLEFSK